MSGERCMDCGVVMSPESTVCSVCGFDNDRDRYKDMPVGGEARIDYFDEVAPDINPGF